MLYKSAALKLRCLRIARQCVQVSYGSLCYRAFGVFNFPPIKSKGKPVLGTIDLVEAFAKALALATAK